MSETEAEFLRKFSVFRKSRKKSIRPTPSESAAEFFVSHFVVSFEKSPLGGDLFRVDDSEHPLLLALPLDYSVFGGNRFAALQLLAEEFPQVVTFSSVHRSSHDDVIMKSTGEVGSDSEAAITTAAAAGAFSVRRSRLRSVVIARRHSSRVTRYDACQPAQVTVVRWVTAVSTGPCRWVMIMLLLLLCL